MYPKMPRMKRSTIRATPIMLVCATCLVPLGLMPVIEATTAMNAARMSQVYQVMTRLLQDARRLELRNGVVDRRPLRQKVARHRDDLFDPDRLEQHLGFEPLQFGHGGVVDARVAGDDGDGRVPMGRLRAEAVEKADAVHERHPQVEQDRVGRRVHDLLQSYQGRAGDAHIVPFELERLRERVQHRLVVIDDENTGRCGHLAPRAAIRRSSSSCSRISAAADVSKYSTMTPWA